MMGVIYSFFDIVGGIITLPGIFYIFLQNIFWDNYSFTITVSNIQIFKFLLDIPLSYYLYKFKNKRNNTILFHDIKFCIIMAIIWTTQLDFLPNAGSGDLGFIIIKSRIFIAIVSSLESIIRTIICFKKKDKKKYKSSLLITLSFFIVMILSIIIEYGLIKLEKDLNIILHLICMLGVGIGFIVPSAIISFYAVSSTFFTFYLIYKSIRKLIVRNKNIS